MHEKIIFAFYHPLYASVVSESNNYSANIGRFSVGKTNTKDHSSELGKRMIMKQVRLFRSENEGGYRFEGFGL